MKECLLDVIAVEKSYQINRILTGFNLTLLPGTVMGIMGASGCGKSTLLRLIAGLERPDGGEIRLNGSVISNSGYVLAPQRRQMGMVFQHLALWPHLTVYQHLEYGLPKVAKPERDQRIHSILSELRLENLQDRHPFQLSGGERQRVALGRTLIGRPLIILCDEPFSSLDRELRAEVRSFFYQMLRNGKHAAIFVSHDPDDLAEADCVCRMTGDNLTRYFNIG